MDNFPKLLATENELIADFYTGSLEPWQRKYAFRHSPVELRTVRYPPAIPLSPEAEQSLSQRERGLLHLDDYHNLPLDEEAIILRRRTVRDDPELLVKWAGDGLGEMGIAQALGMGSWPEVRRWANRMDKKGLLGLDAAMSQAREVMADKYIDYAEVMLNSIGTLTTSDGGTMSLTRLAEDHQAAVEEQRDSDAFLISQRLPIMKEAIVMDAMRKSKLADFLVKKAGFKSPLTYGIAARTNNAASGPAQNVSIHLDMGSNPTPVKVVNEKGDKQKGAIMTGITLDM